MPLTVVIAASPFRGVGMCHRSLQNFNVNQPQDRMPEAVIRSFGLIKQAAAMVNARLGTLPEDLGRSIAQAASEVASLKLIDHFPLTTWQTGSGTQTNMNTNEVVANRASELMGGRLGSKEPVHPNNHVNMSGSSNDGMATAMNIAAVLELRERLVPSLSRLRDMMHRKAASFDHIVKIGRTHLQDAVPLTLGQEFSGYAAQLDYGMERVEMTLPHLRLLAQGGTAVGTCLNVRAEFPDLFCSTVSDLTGEKFTSAPNKMEAIAANDAIVMAHGALNVLACSLFKIAQDIRFLGSGPRCGLGELLLPANEPGSSFMPGKVNPTQCESLTMICAQVMANHTGVTVGGMSGQFELNAFKPMIIRNLVHSVRLLSDGMDGFGRHCLQGLEADERHIGKLVNESLMLVTCLSSKLGYDLATKVAKNAYNKGTTLKESALELQAISEKEFDEAVRPELMVGPIVLDAK